MTLINRQKLNSRKLFVALFTFLVSTALLLNGSLESGDFSTITLAIVGSYMASQGYIDGKKGNI